MCDIQGESRKPLFSIVIPYYNPGPYFELAIKSVFAQTVSDWELLLIDDGSRDGSQAVAASIRDKRVKAFADGANRGLSSRLNEGARLASGEFLFRMDADDMMHPERLEQEGRVLGDSSDDTVLGTACYSIDANSEIVGWRPALARMHVGYRARHSFLHPSVAARTAWFRANPYSEEPIYRRSQDAELWCRTAPYAKFSWIQRPLQFYRELGVFSLPNYLATGSALVHLIKQIESNPVLCQFLIARERAKSGIAMGLSRLNRTDLLVRNRLSRLNLNMRSEAEQALKRVMETALPLG
jgi:glycosyltransferase involved in cell wall biosynthesis